MRLILTICGCVALAYGRPEPQSGYNYQSSPSSRYGAPSGAGGFAQGGPSFGGHSGFGSASGGQSNFGHSGNGGGYPPAAHSNVVTKNVYVHLAPPDVEERHQKRQQVHVPPPQKHYKIIFIKAPTPPTPTAPEIPPIPQDEQKTLVYVLIKKPEEQPEIVIPTAPPTEPSKPEVYFIKYKAQKDESGGHDSIGSNDIFQDDTVVVDARQGGAQNGGTPASSFGSNGGASASSFGSNGGASASSFGSNGGISTSSFNSNGGASTSRFSSNGGASASSFSSNGVASQYGPPDTRGAY